MDISVCVPVYNVEPYLKRCLDSLFSQEFSGTFEVICVDDASTDNSLSILNDYQLKEPRLKVLQLAERKKISVVRSTAICAACGDYIMQVDSDDWLQQGALASLYQKCLDTNADIVVYDYVVEDSGQRFPEKHFDKEGFVAADKGSIQEIFSGASVCKILKRSLVADLLFHRFSVSWGDDFLFNTEILLKAQTIYLLPVAYYIYCINHNSITFSIMKSEFEMLEDRIASVKATSVLLNSYVSSDSLQLSLLNYHKYKLLILLLRVNDRTDERIKQLERLKDSMKSFPLMTRAGYINLCLTVKYPLYALAYMALRFDFKQALGVFHKKYIKR